MYSMTELQSAHTAYQYSSGELLVAGDAVVQPKNGARTKEAGFEPPLGARGTLDVGARLGPSRWLAAALATGGVHGARSMPHGGHDGAAVLSGLAMMLDGQAVVDAAVAGCADRRGWPTPGRRRSAAARPPR